MILGVGLNESKSHQKQAEWLDMLPMTMTEVIPFQPTTTFWLILLDLLQLTFSQLNSRRVSTLFLRKRAVSPSQGSSFMDQKKLSSLAKHPARSCPVLSHRQHQFRQTERSPSEDIFQGSQFRSPERIFRACHIKWLRKLHAHNLVYLGCYVVWRNRNILIIGNTPLGWGRVNLLGSNEQFSHQK